MTSPAACPRCSKTVALPAGLAVPVKKPLPRFPVRQPEGVAKLLSGKLAQSRFACFAPEREQPAKRSLQRDMLPARMAGLGGCTSQPSPKITDTSPLAFHFSNTQVAPRLSPRGTRCPTTCCCWTSGSWRAHPPSRGSCTAWRGWRAQRRQRRVSCVC